MSELYLNNKFVTKVYEKPRSHHGRKEGLPNTAAPTLSFGGPAATTTSYKKNQEAGDPNLRALHGELGGSVNAMNCFEYTQHHGCIPYSAKFSRIGSF